MSLAEKVRKRRLELGWSQEELAIKMGYKSRTSINKIECGRPVTQKIIYRLAQALSVSLGYLMGWSGPTLSDRIEEAILVSGKTYEEVAEALGRTPEDIARMACGDLTPDADELEALARYLDLPITFFFPEDMYRMPQNANISENEKPAAKRSGLDEELVNLLMSLSPGEVQRVKDFVAGLKASSASCDGRSERTEE